MKEDLFEEEKVDKNGKESSEVEETEESPWDELPEDTAEDEDVDTLLEDEETEMLPDIDEEEAEAPSDEDKAWIPLDDEELEISSDEGEEAEEATDDEIAKETPLERKVLLSEDEEAELMAGIDYDDEEEMPPWDEGIEIPVHGEGSLSKKKKTFLVAGLLFLITLIVLALYVFLQPKQMVTKVEDKFDERSTSFMPPKIVKTPIKGAETVEEPEKTAPAKHPVIKENAPPTLSGKPATSVDTGATYSFIPETSDPDTGDTLTFFIANQPVWTSFDTATGVLTGKPRSDDVGTYEGIVILVSDGAATTSLPSFDLTVTDISPARGREKQKAVKQAKVGVEKTIEKKKELKETPEKKREKETADSQYILPDLTGLIKQSKFQDAALAYHEEVRHLSEAYSLKLEVDCLEASVRVAFTHGNFDRRMFILPKQISEKSCFVVFWGIYTTQQEALKALSSVPAFFREQATKPELVLIKRYL